MWESIRSTYRHIFTNAWGCFCWLMSIVFVASGFHILVLRHKIIKAKGSELKIQQICRQRRHLCYFICVTNLCQCFHHPPKRVGFNHFLFISKAVQWCDLYLNPIESDKSWAWKKTMNVLLFCNRKPFGLIDHKRKVEIITISSFMIWTFTNAKCLHKHRKYLLMVVWFRHKHTHTNTDAKHAHRILRCVSITLFAMLMVFVIAWRKVKLDFLIFCHLRKRWRIPFCHHPMKSRKNVWDSS